jgi:peroxiredoxin
MAGGLKIAACISLFILSFGAIFPQDISYGTEVETVRLIDCFSKEFLLPIKNSVTLIYFFSFKNPNHLNILLELEYLFDNLNIEKTIFNIVAVSSSDNSSLQSIYKKYRLEFFLIRDEFRLAQRFQTSCESCLRVILIDKHSRIRYLSSQFDGAFLRQLIQRYAGEGS